MKPDINNPGPVDVTPKPTLERQEIPASLPEQGVDKVGELPTATSVPASAVVSTTTAVVNPAPVASQPASQPVAVTSAKDQFEAQLAQLPAEDNEVIEKAWVDKADEIVEKTKDDPYLEDEAQHSLSRAYLKKRFNLDVD